MGPVQIHEVYDHLVAKIEARLRALETIDLATVSTMAGEYRLSWLIPPIDQDP